VELGGGRLGREREEEWDGFWGENEGCVFRARPLGGLRGLSPPLALPFLTLNHLPILHDDFPIANPNPRRIFLSLRRNSTFRFLFTTSTRSTRYFLHSPTPASLHKRSIVCFSSSRNGCNGLRTAPPAYPHTSAACFNPAAP